MSDTNESLPPLEKYDANIDAHWDAVASRAWKSSQSLVFQLQQRERQLADALCRLAEVERKRDEALKLLRALARNWKNHEPRHAGGELDSWGRVEKMAYLSCSRELERLITPTEAVQEAQG